MKQSDVSKAFALISKYTSQFDIGQVFQSEEEFAHWFSSPLLKNLVTYVVEESNSGNITDMFSFVTGMVTLESGSRNKCAWVVALVVTKSPAELITDLWICAKQQSATMAILPQFGLEEHLFADMIKSSTSEQIICYNYMYPEVDNGNHCLFWNYLGK